MRNVFELTGYLKWTNSKGKSVIDRDNAFGRKNGGLNATFEEREIETKNSVNSSELRLTVRASLM